MAAAAGPVITKASEIPTNTPTGIGAIRPNGQSSPAVKVYIDNTTSGGPWIHVGTFYDNNELDSVQADHPWGYPLNPTQDTGIWEDSNTLNGDTPTFTQDYKNIGWSTIPFSQILLKDSGNTQRNLLYTNSGQITTNNSSLSQWFGSLEWDTNGSENSNSAYNNSRVTGISVTNFNNSDPILDSSNKSILLFKFGERDGAQDGNKDRSMIAYHRHDQGDNVDAPAGIGNFTNRSGTIDYRDIVPFTGRGDFPASSITGAPHAISIWIK